MLKKDHEIVEGFVKKPWKKFALREVKAFSRKKSQSYVHNSLKKLVMSEILSEEKVGNSILYSINFESPKGRSFAGFVAEYCGWGNAVLKKFNLRRMFSDIPTVFFVFLITGSYARGNPNKNSDIDVVILCGDDFEPKRIYAELKRECELNIPPVHLYVFKKSEFVGMLLDSKENYGKEIVRNNLVLFGGSQYFSIIGEAIKNGFKG